MKTKTATHTSGPWATKQKAEYTTRAGGWVILYDAQPGHKARLDHAGEFSEENARLIAAAPELLEAAKFLIMVEQAAGGPNHYEQMEARHRLRAAIAKAEGR